MEQDSKRYYIGMEQHNKFCRLATTIDTSTLSDEDACFIYNLCNVIIHYIQENKFSRNSYNDKCIELIKATKNIVLQMDERFVAIKTICIDMIVELAKYNKNLTNVARESLDILTKSENYINYNSQEKPNKIFCIGNMKQYSTSIFLVNKSELVNRICGHVRQRLFKDIQMDPNNNEHLYIKKEDHEKFCILATSSYISNKDAYFMSKICENIMFLISKNKLSQNLLY